MNPESFFKHCWYAYIDVAPQAQPIWDKLISLGEDPKVDHIALRTFAWQTIDLNCIGNILLPLGYHPKEEYHFPEKGLRAMHYDAGDDLPLIFVSELNLKHLSHPNQEIIINALNHESEEPLSLSRLAHHRPWKALDKVSIEKVWTESEYAGWLLCHGIRVNHFTVEVHSLTHFANLNALDQTLKKAGFMFNESGGEIKGSPELGLEQSSTMAPFVSVRLTDGLFEFPGCYVEFAKRYELNHKLFRGFLRDSASKIFESTHR